ncbi:MAG: hypothetical protein JXL80_00040 [Planctomycetes bacterium]|nr:hypothetical protein [Planctomycetota bacterium]
MKTGSGWFWIVLVLAATALATPRLGAQEPAPMDPIPMKPVDSTTPATEPAQSPPAGSVAPTPAEPEAVEPPPVVEDDEPAQPIPEATSSNPFGVSRSSKGASAASGGTDAAAGADQTQRLAPKLIREGKRLFERRGRVSRQGPDMILLLEGHSQPLVLVRTKPLERIEDLSDYGRQGMEFVVSGMVSEYRGRNYFMLDSFRVPRVAGDGKDDESGEPAFTEPVNDQTDAPSEPAAPQTRDRTAAPDAIERGIPEAPPVEEPATPSPSPQAQPGGAATLLRQDKRLTDREGRIVRQNRQTLFVFDSGDKPLVLLPNMKLQQMEDMSDFGRRAVRYRISAMVTEYRSQNYLMMSKMVIIPKETEKL